MMKKIIYMVAGVSLIACNTKKEPSFTIEGSLKSAGVKTIYLEENGVNQQPVVVDSAHPDKTGHFVLSAIPKEEGLYTLRDDGNYYPFAAVISDTRKMDLNADLTSEVPVYSVKGSEASQAIIDLQKKISDASLLITHSMKAMDSTDKLQVKDSLSRHAKDSFYFSNYQKYQAAVDDLSAFTVNLIDRSRSPTLVLFALDKFNAVAQTYGMHGFTPPEMMEILTKAAAKFPDHKALAAEKQSIKLVKAPDFNLPDTSGRMISLSSFRGKYLLLDFWASWCEPCRKENPNVVSTFNRFKNKNFTILSVSLDKTKDAWIQAIQEDGLTWNHVSDLREWNSAAAALYGIQGIPYNFLIDPQGNIIAENIRGPELPAMLGKILR